MDGSKFDEIAKALGRGTSRRRVLKGIAGAFAGTVVLKKATEAAPAGKTTICHFPPGNPANVQIITVGNPSLPAHYTHGDTIYGDCCSDSDCSSLTDQCNIGVCQVGEDHVSSCVAKPLSEETLCDDELFCTINDHCDGAGNCIGDPNPCSDGIACTDDSCDEVNDVCVNIPNNANCASDGNVCTDEVCSPSSVGADPTTGCISINNTEDCNDHDECTVGDICNSGICSGTPLDCTLPPICKVWDQTCSNGACNYVDRVCDAGMQCDPVTGNCVAICIADDPNRAHPDGECSKNSDCCSNCCQHVNKFCLPAAAAGSGACLAS